MNPHPPPAPPEAPVPSVAPAPTEPPTDGSASPPATTFVGPPAPAPPSLDPRIARALADEELLTNLELALDLDLVRYLDALTLEEVR